MLRVKVLPSEAARAMAAGQSVHKVKCDMHRVLKICNEVSNSVSRDMYKRSTSGRIPRTMQIRITEVSPTANSCPASGYSEDKHTTQFKTQ